MPVAAGTAVGLVVAWSLARLLLGFLFEVSPGDPTSLVGAAFVLDPSGALRAE